MKLSTVQDVLRQIKDNRDISVITSDQREIISLLAPHQLGDAVCDAWSVTYRRLTYNPELLTFPNMKKIMGAPVTKVSVGKKFYHILVAKTERELL